LVLFLTAAVMIASLVLATRWVEAHPVQCDAECRALRDRQWRALQ
jgi:hypothetical protein